jgi:hypothetical protein
MEGIEDSGGLGFDLPSLSQSPQMFSGFNAGGPAIPHSGGSGYQDESISGNVEENGDAKRRRIARVRILMAFKITKRLIGCLFLTLTFVIHIGL